MKKILLSLLLLISFSGYSQCMCEGEVWVSTGFFSGYFEDYSEPITDCDEISNCRNRSFFGFEFQRLTPTNCETFINNCLFY